MYGGPATAAGYAGGEEAGDSVAYLVAAKAEDAAGAGLDTVFLVAPSSPEARLRLTAGASSGFVYAASLMGVTGARAQVSVAASDLVARTRAVSDVPVCVGTMRLPHANAGGRLIFAPSHHTGLRSFSVVYA